MDYIENELKEGEATDRNLVFDAFTYGIEDGGLRSQSEINMIICYVLTNAETKLNKKVIVDTMTEGGIANYFETTSAVSKLIKNGIILEDENGYLIATKECKRATEIVEKDLPLSIREKSIKLSTKLAVSELYRKENKVEIVEENGSFSVILHVTDKDKDYMVLKLNVPTITQAETVKEKFLADPVKIYDNLISSIFE